MNILKKRVLIPSYPPGEGIAVFDLDHTLVRANLSFLFGKFLFQKGLMPYFSMFRTAACYGLHKGFGWSLEWLHQRVLDLYLNKILKNKLTELAGQFLDLNLDKLYNSDVLAELKEHQRQGRHLALCSSSPDFLVKEVADRLQVPYWCASCYQVDTRGYLCKIDPVVNGAFKAEYLGKLMTRYGILREAVSVYSDSILDMPLFALAGDKVAVNPDRKLKKHLIDSSWRVIDYEKS